MSRGVEGVAQEGDGVIARQDAAALTRPIGCGGAGSLRTRKPTRADRRRICRSAARGALKALDESSLPMGSALAPGRLRLKDAGRIEALPGFDDGRWWVQDSPHRCPS